MTSAASARMRPSLSSVPIQIGAQTSLARPGTCCDRGPETQREPQFQCTTGWLGAANRSGLLAKQTVQPALSSLRFWHQEGLQAGQRFWAHPNVYPGPISGGDARYSPRRQRQRSRSRGNRRFARLTAGGSRIRTLSPAGKKRAELCEREPESGYASGKAENMIA